MSIDIEKVDRYHLPFELGSRSRYGCLRILKHVNCSIIIDKIVMLVIKPSAAVSTAVSRCIVRSLASRLLARVLACLLAARKRGKNKS